MTGLWLISYIALWILFLLTGIALLSVFYHLGIVYNRIENVHTPPTNLKAGETLPEIALKTLAGSHTKSSQFRGAQTAFLVVSPRCSGCLNVLKTIAGNERFLEESALEQLVIVSVSDVPSTLEMIEQTQFPEIYPVLTDTNNSAEKAWGINTTPVIIEVTSDLKISRQTLFVSN